MRTQESASVSLLRKELEYRNYSPRTIGTYCDLMGRAEGALQKPLSSITVDEFKGYLHRIITQKQVSTSSINQNISAFKIYLQDVLHGQWVNFQIKRPRLAKKLPEVLSTEEVERLIRSTTNVKHKAILMLTYSSGLRKMELRSMTSRGIDSGRMQVHILQGKGKKDRYSILSPKALEMLRIYYKIERPVTYLFEPRGKKGCMMSERTLDAIIKQSVAKAGIRKGVSFHTLRHCFATHLLEQGVNLKLIQQFMGHTSLRTTSVYLHLTKVDLSCIVSPLESMNV
jgi:site-specific recombinase XerD